MLNNEFKPVNYRRVQENIKESLNRMIPMNTIQRYGKEECGIRSKKSREIMTRDSKFFSIMIGNFDCSFIILEIELNIFPYF